MAKLFLHSVWKKAWLESDPFIEVKKIQGEVYRNKEGRVTLRFEHLQQGYFLKLHQGVGWPEIFKNLSQLRLPVIGATNEYLACQQLHQLDIDTLTPVAYGVKGANPAKQFSFLITEELDQTLSLEDMAKTWMQSPPSTKVLRALIKKVALMSYTMHNSGINHRDFYLCHFLVKNNVQSLIESDQPFACYLIDLHRAQIRSDVPKRWLVKDLSGLYFSAMDAGLSRSDYLRFLRWYFNKPLAQIFTEHHQLLHHVKNKAIALYQKDHGRLPSGEML